MSRNFFYIAIAFFGMVSGLPFFHPLYVLTVGYTSRLMAAPFFGNEVAISYFASLMLSTAIIIVAGIPAAIYERFIGAKDDSTTVSIWIWLIGTALLSLPAMGNFFQYGI